MTPPCGWAEPAEVGATVTLRREAAAAFVYRRSASPSLRICEPAAADPLSEADLSTIWAGQRFPSEALTTPDGRAVNVLHPGRLNGGSGPDFRDAIFQIDGRQYSGDIELHVRASMFRSHGHHLDHAYDGVALHVVYLADEGAQTALAGGGKAPVASFAPWLLGRMEELQSWLAAPAFWQDPCRGAAQRLGDEAVQAALREAGLRRFRTRAIRQVQEIAARGADAALWSALLDILGVGGDRDGFRRLAGALPASLAADVYTYGGASALEQALLSVAGLAEAPQPLAQVLPRPLWPPVERPGRPLNRPERRLAALAHLYDAAGSDLPEYAAGCVAESAHAKALIAHWQVSAPGGVPALLGPERAQELVLNAVLPFVAAHRPELAAKVEALLAQLPASAAYGRTAFLEANLARSDGKRRVRSALEQQGLLSLSEEWCRQGGCGRCPLS